MKGEQHLTRAEDFARLHSYGRWFGGRLLGIKSRPNGLTLSRWAVVAGKLLGGAVLRNRAKRRLREIVRQMRLKPGNDIVVMAREEATIVGHIELKEEVLRLMAKAGLLEQNEEDSTGAD